MSSHLAILSLTFFAGAPAIATASGTFVAGNVMDKLEDGKVPAAATPRPPSFDSAWRLEASNLHELRQVLAEKGQGSLEMPDIPLTQSAVIDCTPADSTKEENKQETQDRGTNTQESKETSKEVTKDNDDIPMGYSPGSPVPSSVDPAPSAAKEPEKESKFDKYYHQSLGYKKYSEAWALLCAI